MNLPAGFRIGKTNLKFHKLPRLVERIRTYLDRLPGRKLKPTRDLAAVVGVALDSVRQTATHPALQSYRCDPYSENFTVWGSKKTIQALRRALANQRRSG